LPSQGAKRPAKKRKIEINFSARYNLMMNDSIEYLEYTGTSNKAQIREGWYFGGGMIFAAKTT
jgi:hypothetical protein